MLELRHHESFDEPKSAVVLALEAVYEAIKSRLIVSPGDKSGIILYGTKKTSDAAFAWCNILMPLGAPSASQLRRVRRIIESKFH
ncbi:ATP-dependent DNA helicase II subunit 1 [Sugiyamaella lignohabitans]|uniref:ATP-dependent DNA helicase II subunit 1 n=1 Tax=Sugiyamaella lignohabitans TaxID=796027 RepID=A0A161HFA3_9ASCO|nr:ATP-dependent DNA helicase II subunit 1 [Sugiyamaella lignohabitans]ANB11161.1 ATP-dependent DNA helicase II subunit 1 [Sugiyamaella lignohabitans]